MMLEDLLTFVVAVVSAVLVGFVARRILATPVGWPRSIVVGLLVFFAGLPFAGWVLDETAVTTDSGDVTARTAWIALAVIVLSVAWVFAAGVAVLVALEAIFPTRPLPNVIDVVRAALQQRRRTRRYLEIVAIASRHGAGWIFHGHSRVEHELTNSSQRAHAIVAALNASGVTFVKLGQVLSTRRDLVPEPYLSALATLQMGATTLPWEVIEPAIENSLGAPLDTLFASVDREPLAAASVAQVHTARLLDGTPVVVKVQRPAARAQVEADSDIVLRLADRAEARTSFARDMHVTSLARGFTSALREELDYRIEARNAEMMRATLALIAEAGDGTEVAVSVPRVFAEASNATVITMELVDGVPLSHAGERLAAMTDDEREALATTLMSTVIEQILVYGVFHADLHPGNVILREDGSVGLIDFGAVGVIERSQRENLTALMLAALGEDDVAATDALLLIVDVPDDADLDGFRHDIGVVLTTERFGSSGSGSIFSRMVDVIRQHRIALPGELASAFRSFATLEGCLRVVVADYSMIERALPLVPKLLKRMVSLRGSLTRTQSRAIVTAAIVRELPRRVDTLLSGLENGTIGVRVRTGERGGIGDVLRSVAAELVGTLASIAAVVLAVVLIVADGGPALTPGIGLFDLLGAAIGFFGFLALLSAVRQVFVRRRAIGRS